MKIDCPHCEVHGSVDDSLVRRKLQCPKCSKVFLVSDDLLPEVDETTRQTCSACNKSFASELLVEIDSQLFCVLCRPDFAVVEEEAPEEVLETAVEEEVVEEAFVPEAEEEVEEESVELETCSKCGDSLHPDFLTTVDSEKYCALCLPEEEVAEEEEPAEPSTLEEEVVAETMMADEIEAEEEGDLTETCSVCGEEFHPDFLQEVGSKLYCGVCQPDVVDEQAAAEKASAAEAGEPMVEVLEEAAEEGGKGPNWLVLIVIAVLCGLAFWLFYSS